MFSVIKPIIDVPIPLAGKDREMGIDMGLAKLYNLHRGCFTSMSFEVE